MQQCYSLPKPKRTYETKITLISQFILFHDVLGAFSSLLQTEGKQVKWQEYVKISLIWTNQCTPI